MVQVRIHGRGGQGVVTAAELLSVAAFLEGRAAQAFPSFGSERMGAPVVAFCRMDDRPIRLREPITEPDALVIQDPTLLSDPRLCAGLHPKGFVVINASAPIELSRLGPVVEHLPQGHVRFVPATAIARQYIGRPLPNAAMLGALLAATGYLKLDSLLQAISEKFNPVIAEKNHAAARASFEAASAVLEVAR